MSGVTTDISRDVPWARLDVKTWLPRRSCRRIYRITALSPPRLFGVHNNNLVNLVRGVRERVFAVESDGVLVEPPRPEPGFVAQELGEAARILDRIAFPTTRYTYEQFVGTYTGRRRTIYEGAVASLASLPVHRGDSNSKAFLKCEKLALYLKGDPAARLIHPRDPRYNVEVGRFVKRIEHDVYHAVDQLWGERTILKGYNAAEVASILSKKWNSTDKPVAIGLDASRFDQHVSTEALKWEHARYLEYFNGHDREILAELLSWQLETSCFAKCDDGRIKYKVKGMRFSGDMNTGLGNCLLMSVMVWVWCHKRGINAKLGNNGDDCVLIVSSRQVGQLDLPAMCRWFRELGFTMKVEEPVNVLERVTFCQAHPVWAGNAWVMCREHGHAMAKDCISLKPLDTPGVYNQWRRAVGLCGSSLTGGIPVQQNFYRALAKGAGTKSLVDPTLETGMAMLARGMQREWMEPTPEARYSYWLAFGVTPDEQEALEGFMDRVDLGFTHPTAAQGTSTCPTELLL